MLLLILYLVTIFRLQQLVVAQRPNFIFILTDDQDITLDSMQAMPNAMKYIANEGITFNNTFISTPICCPSRTETISGRNFHNVKYDGQNCMHVASEYNIFNNTNSLFQIFQSNGYMTGVFGKVVNNQAQFWCDKNPITLGFDRINCPCAQGDFYGTKYYDKYENGSSSTSNLNISENIYQTSYIGNASYQFVSDRIKDEKPFIIWIGPHAPHYPATPAAWYADRYNDAISPITPNFNESDKLKHSFVSTNPSITDTAKQWIDQLYRDRLRSLLSVDDLIYELVTLLKTNTKIFDNTYLLLTSDHGYHLGQYDIPCSKQQPYEETIRIPMYFKGPRIAKNITSYDIVGNIDILPTFLSLANIKYDENTYDGRNWNDGILNSTYKSDNWRTIYLSQYQSVGTYGFSHCQTWFPSDNGSVVPGQLLNPPEKNNNGQQWLVDETETNNWRALRIINESVNWMYVEFGNSSWNNASFNNPYCNEFYDVNNDPFQQKNAFASLSNMEKQQLHQMVMKYGACSGTSCW